MKLRRALISVWDKTGIVDFARALHGEFGVEIISTGGTAKALRDAGVPVTLVEDITGCGEMLDGRVKTLHPKIHAAILADRDNPEHMRQLAEAGIEPIDLVVVNLYPFEKTVADPDCTFEQAIEMIDIGGVALLRAAAKNHKHVLVPSCVEDCDALLTWLRDRETLSQSGWERARRDYADSAFIKTSQYDAAISTWMSARDTADRTPLFRFLHLVGWGALRYGENAQQRAELLGDSAVASTLDLTTADVDLNAQSKQPFSYNNYLDADAAVGLCAEIARAYAQSSQSVPEPTIRTCVFIKHTNACGVGIAAAPNDAYQAAYLGDPNAAMGGILAVNFPVKSEFAELVMESYDRLGKPLKERGAVNSPGGFFVEVWIAPEFDEEAVKVIRTRKKWGENVRLLAVGDMTKPLDPNELQYRSIAGGMLVQSPDVLGLNEQEWKVVTNRAPSEAEMADLRLAWLICKHTKSNAITLVRAGMLLGNGAGQMSRVMSCRIAVWLARENGHLDSASKGDASAPVAASDAFFPFADGPRILIDAWVTAIIQPGGSKRDQETIDLCNERGVAMIHTGTRHFRH